MIVNKKRKKKKTCRIVDLAVPVNHRVKIKENQKDRQVLRLCQRTKKTTEHESESDNCNWMVSAHSPISNSPKIVIGTSETILKGLIRGL